MIDFSSWTSGRRAAAASLAVVLLCVLAGAAMYLAGALFLLLNRLHPRHAQVTSIVSYWRGYATHPVQRMRLTAATTTSGVLLVGVIFAFAGAAVPRRKLHGNARFATMGEIAAADLVLGRSRKPGPAILVGRHKGRILALPGQLSVMLSAPTRSGKGVGVVIPNLLHWPDSVVALDIKGENFAATAGYRSAHGQHVYAFAPFDDAGRSHRWNPLAAVRTDAMHRVADLLTISQSFYPSEGGSTSSEAFFNDQARNLFLGIGLFLLETPELPRTIGEMLRQASGMRRPLKEHFADAIADREKAGRPLSNECVDALQRLLSTSDNTLTSIVATFNAPLTIFADAVVDAATSWSDFDLADVRRQRMSVYVCIPPNRLTSARPLLNLFFSQLVNQNTRALPEHDPTLCHQCLLLLDEFTAMGRVPMIVNATAFLAGYGLRLLTVVQAMSQLDAVYGEREARSFATNHGLQILYAPREQRDADEYSAMLGYFTERVTSHSRSRSFSGRTSSSVSRNVTEQRRALLLPQEFKELGADRLVIVLENCKPILANKIRYHRDKAFLPRLRPAPHVPQMDMAMHFARAQQRVRDLSLDAEAEGSVDVDLSRVAHNFEGLPDLPEESSPADVVAFVDTFFSRLGVSRTDGAAEEAVEPGGDAIELDLAVLET